jgi:hypothetical protein
MDGVYRSPTLLLCSGCSVLVYQRSSRSAWPRSVRCTLLLVWPYILLLVRTLKTKDGRLVGLGAQRF